MGVILIQTITPNQLKGGHGSSKKLPFYDHILSDGHWLQPSLTKGESCFCPHYISYERLRYCVQKPKWKKWKAFKDSGLLPCLRSEPDFCEGKRQPLGFLGKYSLLSSGLHSH